MDKERCCQVDIDQFDFKILRKEVVCQIKRFANPVKKLIEYEIIMARRHDHIIKNPRHSNKISYSQYQ